MSGALVSAVRLREVLGYDHEAGVFAWRQRQGSCVAGQKAGTDGGRGYRQIRVDGKIYREQRLAWLYVYGEWPAEDVDHVNGIRDDNRIVNLRSVSRAENMQNERRARRNSKTGLLGASPHSDGRRFRADIKVNGKQTMIGAYATAEEAHQAYLSAKRIMHPMGTL